MAACAACAQLEENQAAVAEAARSCSSSSSCAVQTARTLPTLPALPRLPFRAAGGGNVLNVQRTVRQLINVGAKGVFLEVRRCLRLLALASLRRVACMYRLLLQTALVWQAQAQPREDARREAQRQQGRGGGAVPECVAHAVAMPCCCLLHARIAATHPQDQEWPKRAGHMRNKEVISMEEFAGKVRAARV